MEKLSARFLAYLVIASGCAAMVAVIMSVPLLHDAQMFLLPAMLLIAWFSGPVLTHYLKPIATENHRQIRKR